MDVLALEPWYGGSHRHFLDGLVEYSRHSIRTVTMPDRFWKWRMHGGAVTLAQKAREAVEAGFEPDLLFATDMVNLPAFLALTRDLFVETPVLLYVHENQLTYPLPEGSKRDVSYGYINYLSFLAADRIAFNSRFHQSEFMEALPRLLRTFPDYTHIQTVQTIRQRAEVCHLGIDLRAHDRYRPERDELNATQLSEAPIVLWNQRWEYDKDPEAFFRLMNRLDDAGARFRLILAGEHFEQQPAAFDRALERYADRILHYGYAEDFAAYSKLLHRADLVVSTARHEFFGIAIMEAIYCGCHPLLPDRLSYPELIPESLHDPLLHAPVMYRSEDELFALMQRILRGEERPLPLETLRDIPGPLDWSHRAEAFDQLMAQTVEEGVHVADAVPR